LKLQLHKYSADTFRNNPWIALISEREEREREREREKERERLDSDTRIFRAHVLRRFVSSHSPPLLTKLSPLIHFPLPRYPLPPVHLVSARLVLSHKTHTHTRSETYCWTQKLSREDYGVDKYWVLFLFLSRLRFEISRLRLRFFAGVQTYICIYIYMPY
jgi:hypothetical protein